MLKLINDKKIRYNISLTDFGRQPQQNFLIFHPELKNCWR